MYKNFEGLSSVSQGDYVIGDNFVSHCDIINQIYLVKCKHSFCVNLRGGHENCDYYSLQLADGNFVVVHVCVVCLSVCLSVCSCASVCLSVYLQQFTT